MAKIMGRYMGHTQVLEEVNEHDVDAKHEEYIRLYNGWNVWVEEQNN